MITIESVEGQIKRVDDLPVLFGLLKQMGIQAIVDRVIKPPEARTQCFLTRLSEVQERILALLGLPSSLFTDLQTS